MSDPSTSDERSDAGISSNTVSRRNVIAGLGLVGGVAGLLRSGSTGTASARVTRSSGPWRVEVDGQTALQLGPARRVTIDEESFTGGENVRFGRHNTIADGVTGASVAGGGMRAHRDGDTHGNEVKSHFGAVSGGIANTVGSDGGPAKGILAAVGGGAANEATGSSATVAGGKSNEATGPRSAIGGGINNEAEGSAAAVGGGIGNHADGRFASVAGGGGNAATQQYASTAGGRSNRATAEAATVAGGHKNAATGRRATVGGGYYNFANGHGAVVPGGANNVADGKYALAAGCGADTNGHDGAIVVGDSSDESIHADRNDTAFFQMPIRAPAFETTSARTAKTDIKPADPEEVLEKVRALDISRWRFEGTDTEHLGPMAGEFNDSLDIGADEESIATVDADGAALAAIQGLATALDDATERIDELEDELSNRKDRIDTLERRLTTLEAAIDSQASP
ncbi:MAG: tail fiber domain-containing protein [Salinirussus sp.]